MTVETRDAFHAAIDDAPADGLLRMVFADWLDEHGDPRAAGYRAMGALGMYAAFRWQMTHQSWSWYPSPLYPGQTAANAGRMPPAWYAATCRVAGYYGPPCLTVTSSRAVAEDLAALAFASMTEGQQADVCDGKYSEEN